MNRPVEKWMAEWIENRLWVDVPGDVEADCVTSADVDKIIAGAIRMAVADRAQSNAALMAMQKRVNVGVDERVKGGE